MDEQNLKAAMYNFCLRVLSSESTPQEVAALPAILTLLLKNEKAASGN